MIQITDKLFAVEVPEDAYDFDYENGHVFYDMPTGILERSMDLGINKSLEFKIVGTVDKDTIDFDCEQLLYNIGYFYDGNEENRVEASHKMFRSLLASKGLNPNAKHLIIEKI